MKRGKMIAAGIVTYNPNIKHLSALLTNIKDSVDSIIVVDNASYNINEILTLQGKCGFKIIRNTDNVGIARALNQIMQAASTNRMEWVLTLDQDSNIQRDAIDGLMRAQHLKRVAIICPIIYDVNSHRVALVQEKRVCSDSVKFCEVDKCITSGSITNVACWKLVGGYDEYLFIDGVDFDFCWRIRNKGLRILESNEVQIEHEIGKTIIRHFLWFRVGVMNHNSIRKYYMTRNRFYLDYKHYGHIKLKSIIGMLKTVLIVICYEEDKSKKLRAMFTGMIDGVSRRMKSDTN